jgi:uncharacterized protein RhaS with RHS repeats
MRVYDYRARLYQPELGRFLQPDPKEFVAGDYNLYRYCHNDPVNNSDPTGLEQVFGEILRDRMWDSACLGDGGNGFQGSYNAFMNHLYAGPNGAGGGGPATFRTARQAADSRVSEITSGVNAQAKLPTEERKEMYSVVGQAEDGSSQFVTSAPRLGNPLGNITKLHRAKLGPKALTSNIDAGPLPTGYKHVVGFVLGQVAFHGDYVTADINIAKYKNYEVAIIVAPGNKRHPHDYYIPYQKGYPDPVY